MDAEPIEEYQINRLIWSLEAKRADLEQRRANQAQGIQ